jgi:flavin-binding protein dodecin
MSDEDADERKKEMARLTSPEYRMIELVEKLNERVESNAEESRQRAKETQRNIDFIIQHQAQFVTDIQKLSEKQDATREIVERLATVTLSRFERVDDDVSNLESKMSALIDSHIKLADAQKNTDERLNALTDSHIKLADAQAKTDERLSAFIATVERFITEGRNGK